MAFALPIFSEGFGRNIALSKHNFDDTCLAYTVLKLLSRKKNHHFCFVFVLQLLALFYDCTTLGFV